MASCVYDSLNGYGYGFIRCILEGTTVFFPRITQSPVPTNIDYRSKPK